MNTDTIHGLSLRDCAEILTRDGALRAQHGEPGYRPLFQRWLAERGTDENTWAQAWNGWRERLDADASGGLHAEFNAMQRELHLAAHHADVADATLDTREGVTLAMFAEIMARTAGGEDPETLVAEASLGWDQWQKAQAAWNEAMAADVNHHLTTQYGQLYAKHTPGFEQQMQGHMAAVLAAERARVDDDEPDEDYTLEDAVREMEDSDARTRWTAAHHAATDWDVGERGDAALDRAARRVIELARECLASFDAETAGEAEALACDLQTFASEGFLNADEHTKLGQVLEAALDRARSQLEALEAELAPIRDKAVPERVTLQSAVQDHTSLVEELESIVDDWEDHVPDEGDDDDDAVEASASTDVGAPEREVEQPAPEADDSPLAMLKGLPVVGDLLKMLGL